jgi:hypothetical protein
MTTFPTLVPTSRTFESGDYPVKTFKAQNGAEHRILYGSNRTNMKLSLSYANITDVNAEQFLDHFDDVQGTFQTFELAPFADGDGARQGWGGEGSSLGAGAQGNKYRYEGPPQVVQVRPGISTVTVNLIGVL